VLKGVLAVKVVTFLKTMFPSSLEWWNVVYGNSLNQLPRPGNPYAQTLMLTLMSNPLADALRRFGE